MPEVSASDVLNTFSNSSAGGGTPSSISVADGNKLAESNPIQYTPPQPSLPQRVGEDLEKPFVQAQHTIGAGMYWLGSNLKDQTPFGGLGDRITRAGLVMQERAQDTLSKKFSNFTPKFLDQIVGAAPALATFAGMTAASVPAGITTAAIAATAGLGIAAEDFSKFKAQGHSTPASDAFATAIGVPVGGVTALGFNVVGKLVSPWLSKVLGDSIGKIVSDNVTNKLTSVGTGAAMGVTGGAAQALTAGSLELATGATPYHGADSLKEVMANAANTAVLYGVLGGAASYPYVFKQHNALIDGFQKLGMDSKAASQATDDLLGQASHVVMDKLEKHIQMTPDEKSRIQVAPTNQGEVRPNVLDRKGIPLDEFYPSIQEPKSANEVAEETKGNEYVKIQPLDLQIKADEKLTTQGMREKYMGSFDQQLATGAYLREDMSKPAPEQMDPAFWDAHYGKAYLQRLLDDPVGVIKSEMQALHKKFGDPNEPFKLNQEQLSARVKELEQYKDSIKEALIPNEARAKAIAMSQRYFKEAAQVGMSFGTLKQTLENYVSNRLYKPEPPQDSLKIAGKGGLKQFSTHSLERLFDHPVQAIAGGKRFATTNLADLVAVHNQEMAAVNHSRQFIDALSELKNGAVGGWTPQGRLPADWEQVGTLYKDHPYVDKDGNAQISRSIFAAPKGIAKGLKPLVEPDWFRAKIPGVATVQQIQAYTKTGLLGLSIFHDMTFASQTLASIGGVKTMADLPKALIDGTMSTPDWRAREMKFLELNGTTAITHEVQDIKNSLEMSDDIVDKAVRAVVKAPVIKQLSQISEAHTKFLFGQYQRFIKVETFSKEWANWQGKNPGASDEAIETAGRQIAKATNDTFGGRNWEVLGYNKTVQSLLRTFLLAPDWVMSMAGFTKNLGQMDAAGNQARGVLFKTIAGGLAINDALNYLTTGHHMWDNKRGHQWEWESAPDVYTSAVRGMPGEIMKLFSNVMESGGQGFARYAEGKLSPFAAAGTTAVSGVNYFGASIWKGSNEVEKDINAFWNIASHALPIPIGVTGAVSYGQREDQQTPLGWGQVLTGAGRFSKPSDAADKMDLNQRVIQAYRNGNTEFVEHQISEGNLSEEKAADLKADSQLSDAELHVRHMRIDKAIQFYQKASPDDQKNLRDLIDEKYDNYQDSKASAKDKARIKKLYNSLENGQE